MSNTPSRQRRRLTASPGRTAGKSARGGKRPGARTAKAALELSALQKLRTIVGTARRNDMEVRHIAGISGSQLWALSEIADGAGMRVNDLSGRMALHQTTASNLINSLVERNLVRRSRDELDQRVVRLSLTTDGKKMLLRAPGPYAGLLVDALRQLKTSELSRLNDALDVLAKTLRVAASDAAGETLLGE